jgi:hypothetical protein
MAWAHVRSPRNPVNPMVVGGMQQARRRTVAKAVKVVRNHEGGTCAALAVPRRSRPDSSGGREDALNGGATEGRSLT